MKLVPKYILLRFFSSKIYVRNFSETTIAVITFVQIVLKKILNQKQTRFIVLKLYNYPFFLIFTAAKFILFFELLFFLIKLPHLEGYPNEQDG